MRLGCQLSSIGTSAPTVTIAGSKKAHISAQDAVSQLNSSKKMHVFVLDVVNQSNHNIDILLSLLP